MVIPIINVRKGKPGSKGKTSKKPGIKVIKGELNIYDEMAAAVLEKYNQNHDSRGRFAASGKGTGGGGGAATMPASGASSDLPPWMDAKPKPQPQPQPQVQPAQAEKPFKPTRFSPKGVPYGPDGAQGYNRGIEGVANPESVKPKNYHGMGQYLTAKEMEAPLSPNYRKDLAPYVGQRVDMDYQISVHGAHPHTYKRNACIQKATITLPNNKKARMDHTWTQNPDKVLGDPKNVKQWQKARGTVTTYVKTYGGKTYRDFSIDDVVVKVQKSDEPLVDADALIEKYNRNHDARGRFAPSTGGAVGPAGGVISLEDALAGKMEPVEAPPQFIPVDDGRVVTLVDNQMGLQPDEMAPVVKQVDDIAANAKLEHMKQVTFKELDQNVLAQCEGTWYEEGGKLRPEEVIAINPRARDYANQRWAEDHMKIMQNNEMPWLASAHAPTPEAGYKAVLVHEIGHAKMMEHVMKKPVSEWADPNNPMQGDTKWKALTKEAHLERGWQGPSKYGRKNLGEMFSESLALLTIKSSTGDKEVDKYVLGVLAE